MSVADSLAKLDALLVETNLAEGDDAVAKMGVAEDKIKEGAADFKVILTALAAAPVDSAAGTSVNAVLKVKCLQCVAANGAYFETVVKDCFKDCMKVVVDTLATTDEQAVELAAVEAISGLGMKATALESKKAEFVTREAVDLILQVAMDKERKEVVNKAAKNQFTKMVTKSDFKAVATKLVHWLSDDREDDDAEHLAAERDYALTQLALLAKPAFASLWTDEVFAHVLKFLTIVMPTITINEYTRLMQILPSLPQVKAANGTNLIDLVLGAKYVKADADRVIDMLVILGSSLSRATRHEGLVKRLQGEISKITGDDSTKNTLLAKAALIAARAATDDEAEKLVADVLAALKVATNNFSNEALPANLSVIDTLIITLHTLGHKSTLPVVDAMKLEDLKKCLTYLSETLASKEKLVVFAIKKKIQEKKANDGDKLLLGTLQNIVATAKVTASETLMPLPQLSCAWEKKLNLPQINKSVGGPQAGNANNNNGGNKTNGGGFGKGGNKNQSGGGGAKYRAGGPQKRNR